MSTFLSLRSIRVKHLFEKKGDLDYLSWAKAWQLAKAKYPDADFKPVPVDKEDLDKGYIHWTGDGSSGKVIMRVIIAEQSHEVHLAITDHYNRAIRKDNLTSVDEVNTMQRALVKGLALHGLGLNAWTGEKDFITKEEFDKVLASDDKALAREIYQYCELNQKQQQSLSNKFKK